MLSILQAAFGSSADPAATTAEAADFSYLPLLAGLKEIRLLGLEAARSCQLRYVPLDLALTYDALSYAWGDPTPVAPYRVDGKKILISKSLSAALARTFTFGKENRVWRKQYVWVDAISTNQSNDEEKNLYLGEDDGKQDSGAAIRAIQNISEVSDASLESVLGLSHNHHLVSFFERPWWNRVWTLEEIYFADRATVLCGKHDVEWNVIVKATSLWRSVDNTSGPDGHDDVLVASAINRRGLAAKAMITSQQQFSARFPWLSMLASTVVFASTDPRDKLYALAGMSQAMPGFEISYTTPMPEVFRDFAKIYLEQSKDLELLQLAGVNHEGEMMMLSTWIPNFADLDHPMLHYHDRLQSKDFAAHMKNSFKA
ncbi:MAG: hypothetical protein M1818_004920 [Claussenomyces sp. TS43310]|nr:MAG: hypothetical protein M1818_004920 [Claussenomyces sp. TS43310]